jgi:hypothetical protein
VQKRPPNWMPELTVRGPAVKVLWSQGSARAYGSLHCGSDRHGSVTCEREHHRCGRQLDWLPD